MATTNTNIGQYRGSNMGAYRNPKMIVEDPLIGLKSFQQSYNSMFAQIQLQKANEQKEKDEFEKAMSPFADKIYDSQENLKYYSDINRNTFQNSADAAVQELMSGNISKREGQELARKFIDDQSVFNKLSDKLMVNKVALDQLDMSQPETQEFIKIANAFNSKNATIFQNLNKNGGRYEVNGGVKIGDKVYSTTDIGRILGSIEQSQIINENNNTTLNTAIKAISEKSITDIKNLANEGKYGTRDEVISRNIDELDVFMDTSESDDGLNWIFSNKVKDQNKNIISNGDIDAALQSGGYVPGGLFDKYVRGIFQKNPGLLQASDQELMSIVDKIATKGNTFNIKTSDEFNKDEVFNSVVDFKNEIKKNKVKDWYKTNLTKVVDSTRPTVKEVLTSRDPQWKVEERMDEVVTSYYTERIDKLFDEASKLDLEVVGPDDKETLERKKKLEEEIKNTFLNATFKGSGKIEDVIIGKKNPETGETTEKTMMYFMYDTGKGTDKKVVTPYRQVDYTDMVGRIFVVSGIIDGTYDKFESKTRFASLLEKGLPVTHESSANLPLNQ